MKNANFRGFFHPAEFRRFLYFSLYFFGGTTDYVQNLDIIGRIISLSYAYKFGEYHKFASNFCCRYFLYLIVMLFFFSWPVLRTIKGTLSLV